MIPPFSIVIEWDNANHCNAQRSMAMLGRLKRQLVELAPAPDRTPEVLFLFDAGKASGPAIESAIAESFGSAFDAAVVRIEPTNGLGYYQLKNEGASRARGPIVVLIDSDVTPDEGWLAGHLAAYSDPSVQLVSGVTYVAPESLYFKAFALYGDFPIEQMSADLAPTQWFHANNMSARRDLLLAHPFPDLPNFRSQGRELAKTLSDLGVRMVVQPASRVAHPPPNGLWHFSCQALCDGHDWFLTAQQNRGALHASEKGAYWRFRSALRRTRRRFREGRQAVGLRGPGVAVAATIALCFFSLVFVGELLTSVNPQIVKRYFPI